MTQSHLLQILFVGDQNHTLSPLAEAVLRRVSYRHNVHRLISVDSAALEGGREGEPVDARIRKIAATNGIHVERRSRKITQIEVIESTHIIVTRDDQVQKLVHQFGHWITTKVLRLSAFSVHDMNIITQEDGSVLYEAVEWACQRLLEFLLTNTETTSNESDIHRNNRLDSIVSSPGHPQLARVD